MIRTPLLCAPVFVGLATCAVAQRRPAAPARSDTGPTEPPSAPKNSLTRFLESFTYRNLGPAAYSGRVTALADRKSTRLNSSHGYISYAVFCLKKKKK